MDSSDEKRTDQPQEEQQTTSETKEKKKQEKVVPRFANEQKDGRLRNLAVEIVRHIDNLSQNVEDESFVTMKLRPKYWLFGNVIMTCTKEQAIVIEPITGESINYSKKVAEEFNKIPCKSYRTTAKFFSLEQEYVIEKVIEYCKQLNIRVHIIPNYFKGITLYISWWAG